jgi:hypothetical protein
VSQVRESAGPNEVTSSNWSGYADDNSSGQTYSEVSGTWAEPSISCGAQEQSDAAFWVGIDGYTSDTVEQDGTLAQCDDGSVVYWTWWEMFPDDAQLVGNTVSPGDPITASVVASPVQGGTSYKLTVTDADDSADSFTTTQLCADCTDSSAEWIAEAITNSTNDQLEPLSDFRAWSVTNASVRSGSQAGLISTFADDEITMVNNSSGDVEAEPQDLSGGGSGFAVYWGRELPAVPSRVPSSGPPADGPAPGRTLPPSGHPGGSPEPARTPSPR